MMSHPFTPTSAPTQEAIQSLDDDFESLLLSIMMKEWIIMMNKRTQQSFGGKREISVLPGGQKVRWSLDGPHSFQRKAYMDIQLDSRVCFFFGTFPPLLRCDIPSVYIRLQRQNKDCATSHVILKKKINKNALGLKVADTIFDLWGLQCHWLMSPLLILFPLN